MVKFYMRRNLAIRYYMLLAVLMLANIVVFAGPKLPIVFISYNASNGLADNSAQTLKCTRTGRMVITTIGHVNFYDGATFTHIDPDPEHVFPLPKYTGHYHSYFDHHHHLWVKDKKSLTCLNLHTERFEHHVDSVYQSLGMKKKVEDLFADVNNDLWLLSGDTIYGVDQNKAFPIQQKCELQDIDVYDKKVLLQFFANGVVSAFDIKSGNHLYDAAALHGEDSLKYSESSVVCPKGSDYYQIRNGDKEAVLLHFSAVSHQWERLLETPYHLNNMKLFKGSLYIASEYGYWTYNLKSSQTRHYEEFQLADGRMLTTDVNDICFDHQGGMWLGTENRGLLYSRPFKLAFVCYDNDDPVAQAYKFLMDKQLGPQKELPRHVNCVYKDSRGWTWTGTYTGLKLQKSEDAAVQYISQKEGLRNEMVHSVIEDNMHNMWVATSFGISQLYIRDDSVDHIESYTESDNVPVETFVKGRAMKLDDGTIVMQSLDHVVAFHPSNFYENEIKKMSLLPKLVRLMVNGHFVEAGTKLDGKTILETSVTQTEDITVDYNHNTLSLTFSGLNYMRPIQTYYRVRVRGVFNEWRVYSFANSAGRVDSRGMFHLTLTALPPGHYLVELQTSMSPDSWLEQPVMWRIHVKQPWWRTTGIYVLLGFLLVVFVLLNAYYFIRNMRLRFIRNNMEDSLLKHIRNFSERCVAMSKDPSLLTSASDESFQLRLSEQDLEFQQLMLQIVPYVYEHRNDPFTMKELAELTGVKTGKLFEVLMSNIYKSPRPLAQKLRKK